LPAFVYRDSLWHGADMFGTGVASFGHVGGVHIQNVDQWDQYIGALRRKELPLGRAFPITKRQAMIRELILQLKTGQVDAGYFRQKFGVDVISELAEEFEQLEKQEMVVTGQSGVRVTMDGLLQIDRHLPMFFEPQFRNARYT